MNEELRAELLEAQAWNIPKWCEGDSRSWSYHPTCVCPVYMFLNCLFHVISVCAILCTEPGVEVARLPEIPRQSSRWVTVCYAHFGFREYDCLNMSTVEIIYECIYIYIYIFFFFLTRYSLCNIDEYSIVSTRVNHVTCVLCDMRGLVRLWLQLTYPIRVENAHMRNLNSGGWQPVQNRKGLFTFFTDATVHLFILYTEDILVQRPSTLHIEVNPFVFTQPANYMIRSDSMIKDDRLNGAILTLSLTWSFNECSPTLLAVVAGGTQLHEAEKKMVSEFS